MNKQNSSLVPQTATAIWTPAQSGILQRKCACGTHTIAGGECESCRKEKSSVNLQHSATIAESAKEVPPVVHEVLRSSGQPLDAASRSFFEPRFGHDFSHVRVHTDSTAAESARRVNALAYTIGRDVVFDKGRYAPETSEGRRLLAHELSHVVQQAGSYGTRVDLLASAPSQRDFSSISPAASSITLGLSSDAAEHEADQIADYVARQNSADRMSARVHDAAPVLRAQGGPAPTPTPEQLRKTQLSQLATRPSLALRQWRTLSQDDRDQIKWNMLLLYGGPFTSEFLTYAKGIKKPRLGPAGALKGPEYTPKWLFDRGYRHAYGELWVHPSGEELTVLSPSPKGSEQPASSSETPPDKTGNIEERCPTSKCFEDTADAEECKGCCEEAFPEQGSECRKYCDQRCEDKL